jgi:GTPase SAR1 family protein
MAHGGYTVEVQSPIIMGSRSRLYTDYNIKNVVELNKYSHTETPEEICISILGTGGVGKSAITFRFMRDTFLAYWNPTIEDAYR